MSAFNAQPSEAMSPRSHFGDVARRVRIELPRSLSELHALVRRKFPKLSLPITLYRNEGGQEPLTEATFGEITSGDVLIAMDDDGNSVNVADAFKATPEKEPSCVKELTYYVPPDDDREWVTESQAQFTRKESPRKGINQDSNVDHTYVPPNDDREWVTESQAQFTRKEVPSAVAVNDDNKVDHTYVPPNDDREWVTESRAQFTRKVPDGPNAGRKNLASNLAYVPPRDDRDWRTETSEQFNSKQPAVKYIFLEPDLKSSEVMGPHSHSGYRA